MRYLLPWDGHVLAGESFRQQERGTASLRFALFEVLEERAAAADFAVSPLIGRETELAAALAALECHRLVTLTGFGGMGKTRLSVQVAAELADGEGDGV
jgi:hypothetical protein